MTTRVGRRDSGLTPEIVDTHANAGAKTQRTGRARCAVVTHYVMMAPVPPMGRVRASPESRKPASDPSSVCALS